MQLKEIFRRRTKAPIDLFQEKKSKEIRNLGALPTAPTLQQHLIDQYQIKKDKKSGIVNDPNAWADEQNNPRYIVDLIKKVTTVSVETVRLIANVDM